MSPHGTIGRLKFLVALLAAAIAGCGGGGGEPSAPSPTSASSPSESAASAPASATPTATSNATTATSTSTVNAADKAFADRVLESLNAVRAVARKCGTVDYPAVGPVKWQVQAEQAALAHAQWLQQNNTFSHAGAGGSSVGDRLTATGYTWSTVGENIAAGYADLASAMKGWVDSPGHCVNLMNGNFVDLGVSLVPGTSSNTYRTYWGMVLARPR